MSSRNESETQSEKKIDDYMADWYSGKTELASKFNGKPSGRGEEM